MRGHQLRKTITLIAAFALIGGLVSAMPASAQRHRRQVVRGQNTDAPRSVLGIREDARKLPAPRAARAHLRRSSEGLATESVNGNFFTDLDVNVEPLFSEASARRLAVRRVRNVVADGVESYGLSVL